MSVYSTPLISISDDDSFSSEESRYFTPARSTPSTPDGSVRSPSVGRRRSKSVSINIDATPINSPSSSNPVGILNNDLNFRIDEWNLTCNQENRYCSTPTRKLIERTPKRCKITPLKCITNIVTPIQVRPNTMKFDDKVLQLEKEINFKSAVNNSFESTSFVYKNNLPSSKSKYPAKNGNKNKFTFLRFGIRRRSKVEYDRLIEGDLVSPKSSVTLCKIDDRVNSMIHQTVPDLQRLSKIDNDSSTSSDALPKYSVSHPKVVDESFSSLLPQKELSKIKKTDIWRNFCHYPKVLVLKTIRFSPVKRLFSSCRRKLSDYPFRNLFIRNQLDSKPANVESNSSLQTNRCSCSAASLNNHELLNKILLKLDALEDQISNIKSTLKDNGSVVKTTSISCLPPPPPPPPPPLPNLLASSTEVLKRKVMTPDSNQVAKRKGPLKTQFAITVEDIKSVKLRKTPSTMKRASAGTPQTPSIKDGVVHSVKFKPIKRTVTQKKELSHLVSEILSPSKKTDQSERNCAVNSKLREDKENPTISTNFEITPVKCNSSRSVKFRAAKRRDSSLDSPTRKRINTVSKTLVFSDKRILCYD